MGDERTTAWWTSDRSFLLWKYGIGHSQLLMRSFHSDQTHTIDLHFEAVERVELSRTYSGGISIALTRRAGLRGIPLLNLAITSPSGEGLVVCSRVAILRFADEAERGTWPVIQSAMARE